MEGVSTDDIRDIYEIRALLEGLCARWAATRISDEMMAAMEENIYLTEFHEKKGNAKKLLELDNRFHELLYEAGGSKELMRVLKDYHEYVGRVRKVTLGETKEPRTPLTSINRYVRQLRIMTHCWQKNAPESI